MKTMTCKELGGACELKFQAETFEEIVELSKTHGMQMFQEHDAQHMEAMQKIQQLMQNPEDMQKFFNDKKALFNSLEKD